MRFFGGAVGAASVPALPVEVTLPSGSGPRAVLEAAIVKQGLNPIDLVRWLGMAAYDIGQVDKLEYLLHRLDELESGVCSPGDILRCWNDDNFKMAPCIDGTLSETLSKERYLAYFAVREGELTEGVVESWAKTLSTDWEYLGEAGRNQHALEMLVERFAAKGESDLTAGDAMQRLFETYKEQSAKQFQAAMRENPEKVLETLRWHYSGKLPGQMELKHLERLLGEEIRQIPGTEMLAQEADKSDVLKAWLKSPRNHAAGAALPPRLDLRALEYDKEGDTRQFMIADCTTQERAHIQHQLSPKNLGVAVNQLRWDGDILTVPTRSTAAEILAHLSGSAKRQTFGTSAPATRVSDITYWSPDAALLAQKQCAQKG